MQQEKRIETRSNLNLPAFQVLDVITMGTLILIGILLIMSRTPPEFLVQVFVLLIGVKVDVPSRVDKLSQAQK
jgi:hypothetical protein